MTHPIAFAGFRHPHIFSLWTRAQEHPDCRIVGAWENDSATREQLQAEGKVSLTQENFDSLLAESGCTIVAIGDVYARRGTLAIKALEAGKHVIADKPICTSLAEWERIAALAEKNGLSVGCQLDFVEGGVIRQLRRIVRDGLLGSVCTITITAQHPLRYGVRAAWYFEPGQHGGTINDIGIHVFHFVPWLTGSAWKAVHAARSWNAKATAAPHFQDCAQFLAETESGASCFADVSYLAPDKLGYDAPQYWRITVHGTRGVAETSYTAKSVTVMTDEDTAAREFPALTDQPAGYLQNFLEEINGSPAADGLTTAEVLRVSRLALEAEAAARTPNP